MASERISSLDGFRGIAIILVIIYHAFSDPIPIFAGDFGVSIFFVISGYLITTLLLKERATYGDISLKKFYARRVLRIFPVAYLYLAVMAMLILFFSLELPWLLLLKAALYLANTDVITEARSWYTAHYWSLSVEEQFYLIFPFLLTRSVRAFMIVAIVTMAIIPFSNYAYSHGYFQDGVPEIVCQLLRNLGGPLIGSVTAVLVFKGRLRINVPDRYRSLLSVVLFVAAGVLHTNLVIAVPALVSQALVVVMILINIKPYDGIAFRFLNSKVLVWIGVLSYSLYIWQELFTSIYIPWAGIYPPITNSPWLNLIPMILVSYLSYNFFEKPLLSLRRKLSRVDNATPASSLNVNVPPHTEEVRTLSS